MLKLHSMNLSWQKIRRPWRFEYFIESLPRLKLCSLMYSSLSSPMKRYWYVPYLVWVCMIWNAANVHQNAKQNRIQDLENDLAAMKAHWYLNSSLIQAKVCFRRHWISRQSTPETCRRTWTTSANLQRPSVRSWMSWSVRRQPGRWVILVVFLSPSTKLHCCRSRRELEKTTVQTSLQGSVYWKYVVKERSCPCWQATYDAMIRRYDNLQVWCCRFLL